uniref:Coronin n=1 Tax=Cuerna arida TaxID=1464854 RepID=A0A1B6F9M1_9HEMI
MAWRFKASKFKNAAPIVPKPEACVRDISVGSYQTYGNNITASAAFMAFNVDHNGSSLAVLPIDDCGRKSKTMPLLYAHTDTITDMDFSPFHDGLLATGSQDCLVKVWHIPEKGLEENLTNPECTFSHKQRRVETVCFHPTANCLLSTTSYTTLTLWDITAEKELYSNSDHTDVVQAVSWKRDGRLVATSCKDKQLRVIDPRSTKQQVSHSTNSHQSIKDSRVVWLGDTNRILTTGFDSARQREVCIRDLRKFSDPEKTLVLDSSTGILIPLYDPDTCMLFLAGKGDTTISYLEVIDRDPYLVEGIRHSGEQTKGACLVPKRALNVMQAEVNRVLQLTSSSVIPIMYQVPRKSYRDFHSDLFPETAAAESQVSPASWLQGVDTQLARISLDPTEKQLIQPRLGPKPFTPPKLSLDNTSSASELDRVFSVPAAPSSPAVNGASHSPAVSEPSPGPASLPQQEELTNGEEEVMDGGGGGDVTPSTAERVRLWSEVERRGDSKPGTGEGDLAGVGEDEPESLERGGTRNSIAERRRLYENRSMSVQEPVSPSPTPLRRRDSLKQSKSGPIKEEDGNTNKRNSSIQPSKPDSVPTTPAPKRTSTVFGRVSKFRHLKGTPAHKSAHIENIRNLSRQISGECDGFHANSERVAVPLSGPGGKIAVFELAKTGKLPDGVIPALVHGTNIMDFTWDPFNNRRLAVACDDGTIRLWLIPEGGLTEPTNSPETVLEGHSEKIYFIKFHPLAQDVLASGSYDMTVRVWDLTRGYDPITLHGHTDQMFSLSWSSCGNMLATVCKDSVLRVYQPRNSTSPVAEGKGPVGSRGARVTWALDSSFIVVTGFDKVSERQIMVYKREDLSTPLATVGLDVSPAILIPYYDEDSSTLFLTGKGDSTIYAFEVCCEPPFLCPLSHHRCSSLHQGLSFLPKRSCDVSIVEFAKALRLTNTTIEPLSFTVPRIKSDLFQDDLFPPTKVTWEPTMTAAEWFSGANCQARRISLKPEGMDNLSEAQGAASVSPSSKEPTKQTQSQPQPFNRLAWTPDLVASTKQKQEQIQKSVSSKVEVNMKLEQDQMEGVDEREWDE